jgi:hypothetical protein
MQIVNNELVIRHVQHRSERTWCDVVAVPGFRAANDRISPRKVSDPPGHITLIYTPANFGLKWLCQTLLVEEI